MARMVGGGGGGDLDDIPGSSGDVTKREGLQTHFGDAVVSTPSNTGDWGGVKGGDTSFQGAQKGVSGKVPEVTFVDVQGAPAINGTISEGGGGQVANKSGREVIAKIKGYGK